MRKRLAINDTNNTAMAPNATTIGSRRCGGAGTASGIACPVQVRPSK
jgi:hypothetical protein